MIYYIIAFIILIGLLLCCQLHSALNPSFSSKKLQGTLGFVLLLGVFSLVQILTENLFLSTFCQGAFYICIDWTLFFMTLFINEYCELKLFKFINKWIVIAILALDSLNIAVSMFTHHVYSMIPSNYNGKIYYVGTGTAWFNVHLAISYVLVFVIAMILFTKITYAPKFYKRKYIFISLSYAGVVIVDALYLIIKPPLDFSTIGFPLAGVLLFYFSTILTPKELVNRSIEMTAEMMLQGIMITDDKFQLIYLNDKMRSILEPALGIEPTIANRYKYREIFEEWCRKNFRNPAEDFVCDINVKEDVEEGTSISYYTLSYKRVIDHKGRLISTNIVIVDKTESVLKLQEERHIATHDKLTGIYNADKFYEQCANTLILHPNEKYILICSNIYKFRLVNEVFGKEAADDMLIGIAQRMAEMAKPGDVYARIENDRFAYMIPKKNFREMQFIAVPADVVRVKNVANYPFPCYVGVYEITDKSIPVKEMCEKAFGAQELIKGDPAKRVAYYTDEMAIRDKQCKELEESLSEAIETDQIKVFYQPFFNQDGKLLGGEALSRWQHPVRGLLSPDQYIAYLEKCSKIGDHDRFIWRRACEDLKKWNEMGCDMSVSLNISTKDFFFTDIYSELVELVNEFEVDPHKIFLEVDEASLEFDFEKQSKLIERLRKFGFAVLCDRFISNGTLVGCLKQIELDGIKLDFSKMERDSVTERDLKILYKSVEMADAVNLHIGATFIRTKEQEKRLKDAGCKILQGSLYGEAVPFDEFNKRYNTTD